MKDEIRSLLLFLSILALSGCIATVHRYGLQNGETAYPYNWKIAEFKYASLTPDNDDNATINLKIARSDIGPLESDTVWLVGVYVEGFNDNRINTQFVNAADPKNAYTTAITLNPKSIVELHKGGYTMNLKRTQSSRLKHNQLIKGAVWFRIRPRFAMGDVVQKQVSFVVEAPSSATKKPATDLY